MCIIDQIQVTLTERCDKQQLLCAGDALDENFQLSEEDDGEEDASEEGSDKDADKDATDAKRAQQASGSHPLQQSFKAAAGELLKKYGVAPDDAGGCLRKKLPERHGKVCPKSAMHCVGPIPELIQSRLLATLSVQLLGAEDEEAEGEEEEEESGADDAENKSAEVSDEDQPDVEDADEEKEVDDEDEEEEEDEEDDLDVEAEPDHGAPGEHMQTLGKCRFMANAGSSSCRLIPSDLDQSHKCC